MKLWIVLLRRIRHALVLTWVNVRTRCIDPRRYYFQTIIAPNIPKDQLPGTKDDHVAHELMMESRLHLCTILRYWEHRGG